MRSITNENVKRLAMARDVYSRRRDAMRRLWVKALQQNALPLYEFGQDFRPLIDTGRAVVDMYVRFVAGLDGKTIVYVGMGAKGRKEVPAFCRTHAPYLLPALCLEKDWRPTPSLYFDYYATTAFCASRLPSYWLDIDAYS